MNAIPCYAQYLVSDQIGDKEVDVSIVEAFLEIKDRVSRHAIDFPVKNTAIITSSEVTGEYREMTEISAMAYGAFVDQEIGFIGERQIFVPNWYSFAGDKIVRSVIGHEFAHLAFRGHQDHEVGTKRSQLTEKFCDEFGGIMGGWDQDDRDRMCAEWCLAEGLRKCKQKFQEDALNVLEEKVKGRLRGNEDAFVATIIDHEGPRFTAEGVLKHMKKFMGSEWF